MMTKKMSFDSFSYEHEGTFKEYLHFIGVDVPKINWRSVAGGRFEYQYSKEFVTGEWKPTKKAAKESYKALLKARRDRAKEERMQAQEVAKQASEADFANLRQAVGADRRSRKSEWLELNCFVAAPGSPEFDSAMRLVDLGLMTHCGDVDRGQYFEASVMGARAVGVAEGIIGNARFLGGR